MNQKTTWLGSFTAALVTLGMTSSLLATMPQDQSPQLVPPGKWYVQFDDATCLAARTFGEGADQFTLVLRPYVTGEKVTIQIVETHRSLPPMPSGDATITLDPTGTSWKAPFERFTAKEGRDVTAARVDWDFLGALPKARTLIIVTKTDTRTIPLPSAAGLAQTLHDCRTSLLRQWGIDPVTYESGTPPSPDLSSKPFSFGDYPAEALRSGQQGRVVAILSVDANGKVTGCRIAASSKSSSLDRQTCVIGARGRYKPARNDQGMPIAGVLIVSTRWVMPR